MEIRHKGQLPQCFRCRLLGHLANECPKFSGVASGPAVPPGGTNNFQKNEEMFHSEAYSENVNINYDHFSVLSFVIYLKCYCDENSSSRKFPFLLATTLLLHQKCLCKISGKHD